MSDEELAVRAAELANVYVTTSTARLITRNRRDAAVVLALFLSLVSGLIVAIISPLRPDGISSFSPITIAIAVACGIDPLIGLIAAVASTVAVAAAISPGGFAIELRFVPWLVEMALSWASLPIAAATAQSDFWRKRRTKSSSRPKVPSSSEIG